MKKFKFLFLIALIATMFVGCAQSADDDTPIISDAQPTVVESKSFRIFDEIVILYKDASVTYSDGRTDKYKITTIPEGFFIRDGSDYYQRTYTIKSTPVSTIDFFNGTPIIVTDMNKELNIKIELKFSEIYTKAD